MNIIFSETRCQQFSILQSQHTRYLKPTTMTFSGFTKRLHKSQKKAGNKDTAHSQGPSSDDASTRDCSSSSRPSSTPPSVTPAVPPAMDLNQDSCVVPPSVLMPVPDPLLISMSVPEPSAPTPTGKPSRAMDDALAQLAPLHSHIEHPRTPQKIERALESMGKATPLHAASRMLTFAFPEGKVAGVAERLVPTVVLVQDAAQAVAALEATEIAQKIERGIQRFAENIPWLMKSLDEVSKIHPAVTGARASSESMRRSLTMLLQRWSWRSRQSII